MGIALPLVMPRTNATTDEVQGSGGDLSKPRRVSRETPGLPCNGEVEAASSRTPVREARDVLYPGRRWKGFAGMLGAHT